MFNRLCFGALLLVCLTVPFTGCGTSGLDSIQVTPATLTLAVGSGTTQLTAVGTFGNAKSLKTQDITDSVSWTSANNAVAQVSTTGLVTPYGAGTVEIKASAQGFNGPLAASSIVTVTGAGSGTSTSSVTTLTLLPGSASVAVSQTAQLIALASNGTAGSDVIVTTSSQIKWISTSPSIATVCDTTTIGTPASCTAATVGNVTGVNPGTTTITALYSNLDASKNVLSVVPATSPVTISVSTSPAPEPLLSINVVPAGITVSNKGMTGQFLAFGTYSTAPTVRDLTNQVTWITTSAEVASINSTGTAGEQAGLATAMGYTGDSVIYAEMTQTTDGSVVLSNPETFTCKDPTAAVCVQTIATPLLATLTVYGTGENVSTWEVTAPSDTGQPNLIHCGPGFGSLPGDSVCTGTYAVGSVVTLTASPTANGAFGGWSSNCETPLNTPNLTPTCSFTLDGNDSVGAIFY
ncbi:MAG: Ig-like domain-containing protein [Terracidiphilus sp.]|jgi:hypothetical protein